MSEARSLGHQRWRGVLTDIPNIRHAPPGNAITTTRLGVQQGRVFHRLFGGRIGRISDRRITSEGLSMLRACKHVLSERQPWMRDERRAKVWKELRARQTCSENHCLRSNHQISAGSFVFVTLTVNKSLSYINRRPLAGPFLLSGEQNGTCYLALALPQFSH